MTANGGMYGSTPLCTHDSAVENTVIFPSVLEGDEDKIEEINSGMKDNNNGDIEAELSLLKEETRSSADDEAVGFEYVQGFEIVDSREPRASIEGTFKRKIKNSRFRQILNSRSLLTFITASVIIVVATLLWYFLGRRDTEAPPQANEGKSENDTVPEIEIFSGTVSHLFTPDNYHPGKYWWHEERYKIKQAHYRQCPYEEFYLPSTIIPKQYNITLEIDSPLDEIYPLKRVSKLEEQSFLSKWTDSFVIGTGEIKIDVLKSTHCLFLYWDNYSILQSIHLTNLATGQKLNGEQTHIRGVYDGQSWIERTGNAQGMIAIHFNQKVHIGEYSLKFAWYHRLSRGKMEGIYSAPGMVASFFRPINGRQSIPSMDEPRWKTPYIFRIIVRQGQTVLMNTQRTKIHKIANIQDTLSAKKRKKGDTTTYDGVYEQHEFEKSLPMSMTNVGFAVFKKGYQSVSKSVSSINKFRQAHSDGVYESVAFPGTGHVIVSVYASSLLQDTTMLEKALQIAEVILPQYELAFDMGYSLPKLDLVGVTNFRSEDVMESWGLLLFRESDLFFSEENSDAHQLERTVTIISHGIAHQWFGNLVTMKGWDDVWLHEGFATFFEYFGASIVHPELRMIDRFYYKSTKKALDADFYDNTTALGNGLSRAEVGPIINQFNDISYHKGASVLRMARSWLHLNANSQLENFELSTILGHDILFKGIQVYLKTHKLGTATTEDFWNALIVAAGSAHTKSIKFLRKFTEVKGFPLLSLIKKGNGQYVIRQQAYREHMTSMSGLEAQPCSSAKYDTVCWGLLVPYITSLTQNKVLWLLIEENARDTPITVPAGGWVKLNINQMSYYRVHYEQSMLEKLGHAISDISTAHYFRESDVAGLLGDILAVSRAGFENSDNDTEMEIIDAMRFIGFIMKRQTTLNKLEYSSVSAVLDVFDYINQRLRESRCFKFGNKGFHAMLNEVIDICVHYIGFESKVDESHDHRLLRDRVYSFHIKRMVSTSPRNLSLADDSMFNKLCESAKYAVENSTLSVNVHSRDITLQLAGRLALIADFQRISKRNDILPSCWSQNLTRSVVHTRLMQQFIGTDKSGNDVLAYTDALESQRVLKAIVSIGDFSSLGHNVLQRSIDDARFKTQDRLEIFRLLASGQSTFFLKELISNFKFRKLREIIEGINGFGITRNILAQTCIFEACKNENTKAFKGVQQSAKFLASISPGNTCEEIQLKSNQVLKSNENWIKRNELQICFALQVY